MFKRKKMNVDELIDEKIRLLTIELNNWDPESEEYAKITDVIEKLMKARSYGEGDKDRKARLLAAVLTIVASCAQVFGIIFAEEIGGKILRGAAKGLLLKLKV